MKKNTNRRIPLVGMRTIKTAVAVTVSYLVILLLNKLLPMPDNEARWGAFYACIAAVICMQGSIEQTVKQGVSRLIGTAIGGILGLLILMASQLLQKTLFMALMLGGGTILLIWLCNLIKRPAACSIAVIVFCVILFNHAGTDRYMYALNRMFETAVGIFIAAAVNFALPDHRKTDPPTQAN